MMTRMARERSSVYTRVYTREDAEESIAYAAFRVFVRGRIVANAVVEGQVSA